MVEPKLKNRYPNAAVALEALKQVEIVVNTTWLKVIVNAIKFRQVASFLGLAAIGIIFIFNSQKAVKVENSNSLKTNMLSPVALWNFDRCSEPGQPMLANQLGSDTKGAMVRGVTCEKGRFGQAAFFDGVDDLIEIPDRPQFHFTNQMTVTAWVKPLRLSNPPYGMQTIVNKWYAMDSYMLGMHNGNFIFSVAFPGGQWGTTVNVSAPATVEVWTHVVGVFNGELLLLYINGKLAASTTATGTLQYSDRPISIGNHPSWNAFYGFIDEVSLYDVALNETQISQLSSI